MKSKTENEKMKYLEQQIDKLSDDDLTVIYNQINAYRNKVVRIGNYYYKGRVIQKLVDKKWSSK